MTVRTEGIYAELEEVEVPGIGCCSLDVEIQAHVYPAEPMVRYYRDGSGYPGAPAYAEIISVKVLDITTDVVTYIRKGGDPAAFEKANEAARDYVDKHSEKYENMILESCEYEECDRDDEDD